MPEYILGSDTQLQYTTDNADTNWKTMGIVVDGSLNDESEVREQRGIGSYTPIALRAGMIRSFGNARMVMQDIGILQSAINRTNGRLGQLWFRAGEKWNAAEYGSHKYCKIDTLSVECAAGGEVLATMDWKGRDIGISTTGMNIISPSDNKAFMWYDTSIGGITNLGTDRAGGVSLQPVQFSLRVENNIDWLPVIDNDTSPVRGARYIREGAQKLSFGMRVLVPSRTDYTSADLSTIGNVTLNLTNGTQNVTITLYNLMWGANEKPLRPDELLTNGHTWSVSSISIA